jgi:ribonuclease P protein subunit POP4
MKVSPSNLIYHNLVGLSVKVMSAADPSQQGVEGKVVDETSRMLMISTRCGERMIPKSYSRFSFHLPPEVVVEGNEIAQNSEDRLKRLQRRH